MSAARLPKCPACGHRLRTDGAEGYVCSARGGCGSEWDPATLEAPREEVAAVRAHLVVARQRRDRRRKTGVSTVPATYRGSITEHHGPVQILDVEHYEDMNGGVMLDPPRYTIRTADGTKLYNVRGTSLTLPA